MRFKPPLSKEEILKHLNEYTLFKYYCTNFERVGKLFKSELRADKNNSAIINEYKNHLKYADFGDGTNIGVFDYIMKKYNLSYRECLELIDKDFNLGYKSNSTLNKQPIKLDYSYNKESSSSIIYIQSRSWCSKDGKFWLHKCGITLNTLNKYRVYPIEYYWINQVKYRANELAYAYYFGNVDGIDRYKIYQPYDENYKWCSNTNSNVIQGFDQLENTDLLILTKSLKDTMVFHEANYSACSLQAESTKLTEDHLNILKSKTNYKKIVIVYDNDDAGIKYANKITLEYGIPSIFMPEGTKDASEFVENYGYAELKDYVESNLSL